MDAAAELGRNPVSNTPKELKEWGEPLNAGRIICIRICVVLKTPPVLRVSGVVGCLFKSESV